MKIFLSFFAILFISVSSLVAQSTEAPDSRVAPAQSYPIGSLGNPVSAAEYSTFLSDITEPQAEISLDAVQQKYIGTNNPVICYGIPGGVQFAISLEEQMNEVITTVPSPEAQSYFNLWRQNPTTIELANYLNDQYHLQSKISSPLLLPSYSRALESLKSSYPNSITFPLADQIAINPAIGTIFSFVNERNQLLFRVSRLQLLAMDGLISTLNQELYYYHRPNNIEIYSPLDHQPQVPQPQNSTKTNKKRDQVGRRGPLFLKKLGEAFLTGKVKQVAF